MSKVDTSAGRTKTAPVEEAVVHVVLMSNECHRDALE